MLVPHPDDAVRDGPGSLVQRAGPCDPPAGEPLSPVRPDRREDRPRLAALLLGRASARASLLSAAAPSGSCSRSRRQSSRGTSPPRSPSPRRRTAPRTASSRTFARRSRGSTMRPAAHRRSTSASRCPIRTASGCSSSGTARSRPCGASTEPRRGPARSSHPIRAPPTAPCRTTRGYPYVVEEQGIEVVGKTVATHLHRAGGGLEPWRLVEDHAAAPAARLGHRRLLRRLDELVQRLHALFDRGEQGRADSRDHLQGPLGRDERDGARDRGDRADGGGRRQAASPREGDGSEAIRHPQQGSETRRPEGAGAALPRRGDDHADLRAARPRPGVGRPAQARGEGRATSSCRRGTQRTSS